MLIRPESFDKDRYFLKTRDLWVSFAHHGRFSRENFEEFERNIDEQLEKASRFFQETDVLFVTFGTAFCYKYIPRDLIVSNCHKIPNYQFERIRLDVKKIVSLWNETLRLVREVRPDIKVVFTVSPVRHAGDGMHENTLSKAVLLLAEERLVVARHLEAPLLGPAAAPKLATGTWPRSRLEKAYRNYAMEYVRSALPVTVNLFSPHDAGHLLHLTGRLVGMQFYPDIAASFPATHNSGPQGFGAFLLAFLRAEGDEADLSQANGQVTISQKQWGLIAGVPDYHPMCLQALRGLIEGLMTAHDRRLSLSFSAGSDSAPGQLTWTITQKPLASTDDGRFPA